MNLTLTFNPATMTTTVDDGTRAVTVEEPDGRDGVQATARLYEVLGYEVTVVEVAA